MEVDTPDSHGINVAKKLKGNQEAMTVDSENYGGVEGSTSESLAVESIVTSNSDFSYHDDGNDEEDAMIDNFDDSDYDNDYMFDDDDNDCDIDDMFNDDDDDDCDYLSMQAQFDNVDLPPGVEASISWLHPSDVSSSKSTSLNVGAPSVDAGTSAPAHPHLSNDKFGTLASSSSHGKEKQEGEDEILRKYKDFKAFDVVEDFSDHNYNNMGGKGEQPPKAWTKKIQDEWRILQKDLPDTIFVRVYEARMDLMRAVIVGPQGTPYHDGLFVFDIYFPPTYPNEPPMVYYFSGGLRLNPNLYDCGKVCLSLLNTWTGKGSEKWLPERSTMLQVLVSIQALILNANPFYNEPGYERYTGPEGERRCNKYNEEVFLLSLKTMIYTLRRPPKNFEDLVAGHFQVCAHDILAACKAYLEEGALVGSVVKGKPKNDKTCRKRAFVTFNSDLSKMLNGLISNFTRYGVKDCEKFRINQ